jgi:hypothetical protein
MGINKRNCTVKRAASVRSSTITADLADAGRELAVARYFVSLSITDAIDHTRSIVGDQQRAVRGHGQAHWAAIYIFP